MFLKEIKEKLTIEDLKESVIWLNWQFEITEKGNKTKVPYISQENKIHASTSNPATWRTYAEAESHTNLFDGTGLVFADGLCGIDIDGSEGHTVDNPLESEIKEMFKSAYIEKSPSGHGIHIIFRCDVSKLPEPDQYKAKYYENNRSIGAECYVSGITNRFFTFTGNQISNTNEIPDLTDTLISFLNQYMKKPEQVKSTQNNYICNATLTDDEVIEKAQRAKNGYEFSQLYQGCTAGYESLSQADMAFADMLAFWCQRDIEQMERIFKSSGLMREKFDERRNGSTYGRKTLEKAASECVEVYNPEYNKRNNRNMNDYSVSIKSDSGVGADDPEPVQQNNKKQIPPFIYTKEKKSPDGEVITEYKVSRTALADYMRYKSNYIFVKGQSANEDVRRYRYENGAYRYICDDELKGDALELIRDFDRTLAKSADAEEVFKLLKYHPHYTDESLLNSDENIINFQNGILHLDTMELKPHSPALLSSIQIPCNWSGTASESPVFDKFMNDFTSGDKETQFLLLQYMGVCISNILGGKAKKLLFIKGPGDTGKSQLRILTQKLIGDMYCSAATVKELEENNFKAPYIYNKRLVGDPDMSFSAVREVEMLKKLSSGDPVDVSYKNKSQFSYTFRGLLWFCTNRMPKFSGDQGEHVYRRMIIVSADNVIPEEKKDKNLVEKMYAEREAIVHKAIMAAKKFINDGYRYTIPDKCNKEIEAYKAENNPVIRFYKECCIPEKTTVDSFRTTVIYKAFKEWCKSNNGGYTVSKINFKNGIAEIYGKTNADDVLRKDSKGYRHYPFTLNAETLDEYRDVLKEFRNIKAE